jgi:hypothetical protein
MTKRMLNLLFCSCLLNMFESHEFTLRIRCTNEYILENNDVRIDLARVLTFDLYLHRFVDCICMTMKTFYNEKRTLHNHQSNLSERADNIPY